VNRREFLRRGVIAGAAGAVGLGGYTWRVEPHWVTVVERGLPVAGLPTALTGARLVQISDLHVGPQVADAYLVEALGRVATLRPDIVVVTGDFLTYRHDRGAAQYDQLRGVLAHLPHGRWATLGILGNHDYGHRWSEPEVAATVVREAERAGVRMLRNEAASVRGLDVVGIDDLWARRAARRAPGPHGRGIARALSQSRRARCAVVGRLPGLGARRPHPRWSVQAAVPRATPRAGAEPALRGRRGRAPRRKAALHQPRPRSPAPGSLQRPPGDHGVHAPAGGGWLTARRGDPE
jgi:hypothetical protein